MRGRIFLFVFALPFFAVGVWMGYSIIANVGDSWHMKRWIAVEGTLQRAGYETNTGDDSSTFEAFAEYTYEFGGRRYAGDRVGISGGSDNIGDYQRDTGLYLESLLRRRQSVTVFVDPDEPSQSIIDRSLRWGMIGFKCIFFLVFGGVGLGLIIYAVRAGKKPDPADPAFEDAPWLANDVWQTADIRSDSKASMWAGWGIAAFWNLISAPLPFVVYTEVTEKNNVPALLGLLFPLVGIGLVAWAVKQTLEWRRFGAAPLRMDPYPGSIGGHVGGTIDLNLPYDPNARFSLTLTNVYSYVTGSGKNRSRAETAKWQDLQAADVSRGPEGSRLSFRFDVPINLKESDASRSKDSYYLWRLNLNADLPGVDIDRNYDIPVYATGQRSAHLSEVSIERARSVQERIDISAIRTLTNLQQEAGGPSMYFPMGRHFWSGLCGAVIGSVFTLVGIAIAVGADRPFFGAVFGGIGFLVAVVCFYAISNSLEVFQQGNDIRSIRRILGIPVKHRRMRRSDFVMFRKKSSARTQLATRHAMDYAIAAIDRRGSKIIMAEGFTSDGMVKTAERVIARAFGLTLPRHADAVSDATDVIDNTNDYLATD